MQLSIESLQELGAFTGAPVEREISWKQGDQQLTATVFVRPLSYRSAVSEISTLKEGEPVAARIAGCICDASGKAIFTPADITGVHADGSAVMWSNPKTGAEEPRGPLDGNLTFALLAVIAEVSVLGKTTSSPN